MDQLTATAQTPETIMTILGLMPLSELDYTKETTEFDRYTQIREEWKFHGYIVKSCAELIFKELLSLTTGEGTL